MKKKRWRIVVTAALVVSTTLQSFAAGWQQNADSTWSWILDDNTKLSNSWHQDTDGKWYYLNENGIMKTGWMQDINGNKYFLSQTTTDPLGSMASGWKMIDNVWYFFNTIHDGTFGKTLTGWQWIDGYCYYFAEDGKMFANTITPDGYQVNADGAWVENGKVVYSQGKGIITKTGPSTGTGIISGPSGGSSGGSGGSGGGGSSGGGGGGSSSTSRTYYYTVDCIDIETGNIIKKYSLSGKKGTTLTLNYEFEGYELVEGNTTPELTSNNQNFKLYYQKIKEEKPEETTELTYTIRYVDVSTGKILSLETNKGLKDQEIQIEKLDILGYEPIEDNDWSFILNKDNTEIFVYYKEVVEEKEIFSYTIQYLDEDGNELGRIDSEAEDGTVIKIDHPDIPGYEILPEQETSFTLVKDNSVIKIYYEKEEEIATPSEPEEEIYSYTIYCVDVDDETNILATYNLTVEAGTKIEPDYEIEGYSPVKDYSFVIDEDNLEFTMYYEKDNKEVSYILRCIENDTKNIIHDTTYVCNLGDIITPVHNHDGYTMIESEPVEITENGQIVRLYHEKNKEEVGEQLEFTVNQIEAVTRKELGTLHLYGEVGDVIQLTELELDGYKILGNVPESVIIDSVESNNELNVFYQEIKEVNPDVKDVKYRIEYISNDDPNYHILGTIEGTGKDGEELPVYFQKEVEKDGFIWEAIDFSPRVFSLEYGKSNTFLIKYRKKGEASKPEEKELKSYTINYIAEDTNATLGVKSGYALEDEKVFFTNNFSGYSFKDKDHLIISKDENENNIDVLYKRTSGETPEKNPITNKFDGSEWIIRFVDNEGNLILPEVKGFSLKDTLLRIDYPNTIDLGNGEVYRAEVESPYNEIQKGTSYKQIFIRYTKGDPSETKLEEWKKIAQESINEFKGTIPYEYKIVYREKNSWNDIGLYVGLNMKDKFVNIPAVSIDGYEIPEENLGGFALDEDGLIEFADYERWLPGSSNQDDRLAYKINFKDSEGNDIFAPYEGRVASPEGLESIIDFPVYYPNEFVDELGNRWKAEISSPQIFKLEDLSLIGNEFTVNYNMVYENPMEDMIVENQKESIDILLEYFTQTNDTKTHQLYLIGKDYNPHYIIPGDIQATYDITYYGSEEIENFKIDGITYYIAGIEFRKKFNPDNCTHKWNVVDSTNGSCLITGDETLECEKCKEQHKVIIPALGHIDKNKDTVCDNCGKRFVDNLLGDQLLITFDSGSLDLGTYEYQFVCIDDNYINANGEELMLYLCENDINSVIYQKYSENGLAEYDTSYLKYFLNDAFLDGIGNIRNSMEEIGNDLVSILSKDQYDYYLANSENNYSFPDGVFITSTTKDEKVMLSNGNLVSPEEANNYPVRPIIALKKSDSTDNVPKINWKVGDIQARTIGNEIYLFRCVDDNYKDKSNTSKKLALFLCESVIPADIVNNESTEGFETMFFGENNNYKYSTINEWLKDNSTDEFFNLEKVNIGVDSSYNGRTTEYKFSQLNPKELKKTNFDTIQTMYSNLFILSVEEALQYKNYLWKFDGSNEENQESQERPYCTGYWLRTPQTNTDNMIYTVNLHNGCIEPVSVKATENNDYSTIGIRPAFVMEQYE